MSDPSSAKPHELHAREALDQGGPSTPDFGDFDSVEADPFAGPHFDPDDGSVPPMGDLDTEFFARASDSWDPHAELYETEATPPNPRLIALKSMAARRRRAQFAKYVTAAVGVCGVICLTAMVKLVVSRAAGTDESDTPATAQAMVAAETPKPPATAALQAAAAPQASGAPQVAAAAPVEPQPTASAASVAPAETAASPAPVLGAPAAAAPVDNSAPSAAVASAQAASASEPSSSPSGAAATADSAAEAAAAREVARTELSRGHARQSIEAGERSVALDPTDGEAWLVLGAAYQSKGAVADARRCFKACVSQAKRGPRGECSAMLR